MAAALGAGMGIFGKPVAVDMSNNRAAGAPARVNTGRRELAGLRTHEASLMNVVILAAPSIDCPLPLSIVDDC